jgi:pimeloyl-ACP methyl ester carboxylesterase
MSELVEDDILVNGVKTHLYREGAGEAILFLTGYPTIWEGQQGRYPRVAAQFQIVGLDWPGWGQSQRLSRPHTIKAYAHFLIELNKSIGSRVRKVVTKSFAGLVALTALRLEPQLFDRVIFLNPAADYRHFPSAKFSLWFLRRLGEARTIKTLQFVDERLNLVEWLTKSMLPRSADRARVQRYWVNIHDRIGHDVSYQLLDDLMSRTWSELFAQASLPVLLIAGENDKIARLERVEKIAASNPSLELLVLPGEDHHVQSDANAHLVDSEMLKFLTRA